MAGDLPRPTKCKVCEAPIAWVETRLGRKVPLDLKPDAHGEWVVFQDAALGRVVAPYDRLTHGGRTRYRSHLSRCRAQAPTNHPALARKPDPTAGLKFPRRRSRRSP